VFLLAASLLAGCAEQQLFRGSDDQPIIISGGSLDLDFDAADFTECAGGASPVQRYCHDTAGSKIVSVKVWDDNGNDNSTQECQGIDLCPGGNCRIELTYDKKDSTPITIVSNAKEFYIEFNPKNLTPRPNGGRKHFDKRSKIRSIKFMDNAGGLLCPEIGKEKVTIKIIGRSPTPTPSP